jgi:riboflavin biosynthesis pyrimidine reductase
VRQIYPEPDGSRSALGLAAGRLTEPVTADAPGATELVAELAAVYAYPTGRVTVRANMITSVDGAISVDGRSGGLSGAADRLLFTVLRGLADVILVGAGTARAERYGPAKPTWPQLRLGRTAAPPIAVVTRRLSLDLDSQLLRGDGVKTVVLTTRQAPADRRAAAAKTAEVIVVGDDDVSGQAAIGKLVELGHRRILVEGGPTLLGEIASAGLLGELCVTTSPRVVGGEARRMIESPSAVAAGMTLASVLEDDGFLLSRYVAD